MNNRPNGSKPIKSAALLFIFLLAVPCCAMKSNYGNNECELIAKDFQSEFHGNLVFIQPLEDSGTFDFGKYNGHWMNYKFISGNKEYFFFDWGQQRIFKSKEEIDAGWEYQIGQHVKVYIIGIDSIPFGIHYHS